MTIYGSVQVKFSQRIQKLMANMKSYKVNYKLNAHATGYGYGMSVPVWEQSSMFLDFCNGKPGKG